MFSLRHLLSLLPAYDANAFPDTLVRTVTDRSNEVQPGDVFVAIDGSNFDGHSVIPMAIERGAVAIIVSSSNKLPLLPTPPSIIRISVPNTRLALALLLKEVSGATDAINGLTWVGVTGTNGKTTVATLTEQLLNASGATTAFIGTTHIGYRNARQEMQHINTRYTTPHARELYELALLFASKNVQYVVMEVSSHGLHQHRVAGIPFAAAAFTNLTRDHLDYHGTMDSYALAKQHLFTNLLPNAAAVAYAESEYSQLMLAHCEASTQMLVDVEQATLTDRGTEFTAVVTDRMDAANTSRLRLTTPLVGLFNAVNTALACTLATCLGVAPEVLQDITPWVSAPNGRMERIELDNGVTAIVDFAHTPDGLYNALQSLRSLTTELIVVFGCGGNRDAGKREEMGRIAANIADVVWLTSDNPRYEDPQLIIDQIRQGTTAKANVKEQINRADAIASAIAGASAGAIVLIAGKGHEQTQEINGVSHPFSDKQVVLSLELPRLRC